MLHFSHTTWYVNRKMTKPPVPGSRAASKAATRNALIDAAYAEITEHGPTAPSLDSICARAGFTRGAFYVHFRDREDLLVAVMDRVFGNLLRALASAGAPQQADLQAGVRYFTRAAADRDPTVYPEGALRFHHVLEACRTSPAIRQRYVAMLSAARTWARTALQRDQQQARARGDVDPDHVAQLVLAVGLGALAMLELEVDLDTETLGETVLALLSRSGPAGSVTS